MVPTDFRFSDPVNLDELDEPLPVSTRATVVPPFAPEDLARKLESALVPSLGQAGFAPTLDAALFEAAAAIERTSVALTAESSDRQDAAGALSGELAAVAIAAKVAGAEGLASFVDALHRVVGQLAPVPLPKGRHVIVLDPDQVTCGLHCTLLEQKGHTVRGASTLKAFVALFHAKRPNIILTESEIPDATTKELSSFLQSVSIPVVVVTRSKAPGLAQIFGVDRVLQKNPDVDKMGAELDERFLELLK